MNRMSSIAKATKKAPAARGMALAASPRATSGNSTDEQDASLFIWASAVIAYVKSGEADLTNRQMAVLFVVYHHAGPHTVRGLAQALDVSKPVITRALNRLTALGYLRRERDQRDKRNVFVARTSEGAAFLDRFGTFLGPEGRDGGWR